MSLFASMENSACIILTENMRYAGIVSAASLIKVISEKQLKLAQDQNPLTGLPGNHAIRDFMQEAGRDDEETRPQGRPGPDREVRRRTATCCRPTSRRWR